MYYSTVFTRAGSDRFEWIRLANRTQVYFDSTHQFTKILKPSSVCKVMFLHADSTIALSACMHSHCTQLSDTFPPLSLCHDQACRGATSDQWR